MTDNEKNELIKTSWDLHNFVEEKYLKDMAAKGDKGWDEKQRILLADMAIHLFQTSLKPGKMDLDKLKNNLHSILTITDEFLPDAELIKATDKLFE